MKADVVRPGAPEAGAAPQVRSRGRLRSNRQLWLFLLPALVLVGLFYVVPNLLNFVLGLTDWAGSHSGIHFNGFRNYIDLYEDERIWGSIWTTVRYALTVMVVENTAALTLALALRKPTAANLLLRLVFFLPVLISPLASGFIFSGLLAPAGTFNSIFSAFLKPLGLGPVNFPWFGSVSATLYVVACVHSWKFGGVHMFVYIAGLMAIPAELTEAARVEGAGRWQVFRHVTIPLLGPALTFNITLTLIGALSIFDIIMATTRGGPGRVTEVLNMSVYRQFGTGAFGFATAIASVLFLIILLVAVPLVTYLRRREVEL